MPAVADLPIHRGKGGLPLEAGEGGHPLPCLPIVDEERVAGRRRKGEEGEGERADLKRASRHPLAIEEGMDGKRGMEEAEGLHPFFGEGLVMVGNVILFAHQNPLSGKRHCHGGVGDPSVAGERDGGDVAREHQRIGGRARVAFDRHGRGGEERDEHREHEEAGNTLHDPIGASVPALLQREG